MSTLHENVFGECSCGGALAPEYFIEHETVMQCGVQVETGRTRRAVSHLTCVNCLKNYCVDDSCDQPWHN